MKIRVGDRIRVCLNGEVKRAVVVGFPVETVPNYYQVDKKYVVVVGRIDPPWLDWAVKKRWKECYEAFLKDGVILPSVISGSFYDMPWYIDTRDLVEVTRVYGSPLRRSVADLLTRRVRIRMLVKVSRKLIYVPLHWVVRS